MIRVDGAPLITTYISSAISCRIELNPVKPRNDFTRISILSSSFFSTGQGTLQELNINTMSFNLPGVPNN